MQDNRFVGSVRDRMLVCLTTIAMVVSLVPTPAIADAIDEVGQAETTSVDAAATDDSIIAADSVDAAQEAPKVDVTEGETPEEQQAESEAPSEEDDSDNTSDKNAAWNSLQEEINNASPVMKVTINLSQDLEGDTGQPLRIPANKTITLYMNGHTITQKSEGVSVIENKGRLFIYDGTITGAKMADKGGGICNEEGAKLDLQKVMVSSNSVRECGGGIYNRGTATLIKDTRICDNTCEQDGAGISNFGQMTIREGAEVVGNTAQSHGGGIHNAADLTLDGAMVKDNRCTNGKGGGIYNCETSKLSMCSNTEVSGNSVDCDSAQGAGGGICNDGGEVHIRDSVKVFDNKSKEGDSNVFLKDCRSLFVEKIYKDTRIGVGLSSGDGVVTSGYGAHNGKARPSGAFTSDEGRMVILRDGEVQVWDEDKLITQAYSVTLGESFDIHYKVNVAQGLNPKDYVVEWQFGDTKSEPKVLEKNGDNWFNVAKCAAAQMADEVTVTVSRKDANGELVQVKTATQSIKGYCTSVIEKGGKVNDEMSEGQAKKLMNLCKATLDYGACAQTRFGYKTDHLANEDNGGPYFPDFGGHEIDGQGKAETSGTAPEGIIESDKIQVSLNAASKTQYVVWFKHDASAKMEDYTFSVRDPRGWELGNDKFEVTDSGDYFKVWVNGVAPKDMSLRFTVSVSRGSDTLSYEASPLNYLSETSGQSEDGGLAKALYNFYACARECWDGTPVVVSSWAQLQAALYEGGSITLGKTIESGPNDATLTVPSCETVSLDLHGNAIKLKTKGAVENGSVITNQGNLALTDSVGGGQITGGNTTGNGGGINNTGALAISGVSIVNNKAAGNGGGINNTGELAISGVSIVNNKAAGKGGGVYNDGSISGSDTLVIAKNSCGASDHNGDNLYLCSSNSTLGVTGELKDGTELWVGSEDIDGALTSGYVEHNDGVDPNKYFHCDFDGHYLQVEDREVFFRSAITSWSALQAAINDSAGEATIHLGKSLKAASDEGAIQIPDGKEIVLDLNGYDLDRGLTKEGKAGHVIQMKGSSKLTVRNSSTRGSKITGGWSEHGGGINVERNSTCVVEGVSIEGNHADYGAGIWNDGNLTISGCRVANNSANKQGGGINTHGTAVVKDCTIAKNSAKKQGGGVFNDNDGESAGNLTIENCTIESNHTDANGGGVYSDKKLAINGGSETDADKKTIVKNNSTGYEDGRGCGIFVGGDSETTDIEGAIVVLDNDPSGKGEDIYLRKGQRLNLSGPLAEGARLGVTIEEGLGTFTTGYKTSNGDAEPTSYFCSPEGWKTVLSDGGEVSFDGKPWKKDYEFSFSNSKSNFTGRYEMLDSDYEKLCAYAERCGKGWAKSEMDEERSSEWSGSCYGMSVSALLDYTGQIGFNENFDPGKSTMYKVTKAKKNKKVMSAINYYQLSQITEMVQSNNYYMEDQDWQYGNEKFVANARSGKIMQLALRWGKKDDYKCHSVVVKGYDGRDSKGNHRIKLYDPNHPGSTEILKVTKDFDKVTYDGHTINHIGFIIDFSDFDRFDIDGPNNDMVIGMGNSNKSTDSLNKGSSGTTLLVASNQDVCIENQSGEKLYISDGRVADSSMKVLESGIIVKSTVGEEGAPYEIKVTVEDSESYTVSSDTGSVDVAVGRGDYYEHVTAENATTVTMAEKETLLQGDGVDYTITQSVDSDTCSTLSCSGTTEGDATVTFTGDEVRIDGHDGGNVSMTGYEGMQTMRRTMSSTRKDVSLPISSLNGHCVNDGADQNLMEDQG